MSKSVTDTHPLSIVASEWRAPEVATILAHCDLDVRKNGGSLGYKFDYPIHSAIYALREYLITEVNSSDSFPDPSDQMLIFGGNTSESRFIR